MMTALLGVDLIIAEAGALLFLITRHRAVTPALAATRPVVALTVVIPADADAETVVITGLISAPSRVRSEGDRIRDYWAQQAWKALDERSWPHLTPAWSDSGWRDAVEAT